MKAGRCFYCGRPWMSSRWCPDCEKKHGKQFLNWAWHERKNVELRGPVKPLKQVEDPYS